jgi:hypothetical protein
MKATSAWRTVSVALAASAALLAAWAAPADALIRPVSADYLARSAETVVLASAAGSLSYRTAGAVPVSAVGGAIVTDVRLKVHKVLKGTAAAAMTITVPGGRVGVHGLTCPDAPSFQRGHTYLVYLDDSGQVVAWKRGQPLVTGGRVPALGRSLAQIESRIAHLTGRQATVYSQPPARANHAAAGPTRWTTGSRSFLVLPASAVKSSAARRLGTPVITAITPASASAGTDTVVTVAGTGFGAATPKGRVYFFYQQPEPGGLITYIDAPVVSWSDTAIQCTVPIDTIDDYAASAGTGPMFVTPDGATYSNPFPFDVTFSYGGRQWPRNKCSYRVYGAGHADWELAVRQAADGWTAAAAGGFSFIYRGAAPGGATEPEENGYNDIIWGPISEPDVIAAAWTTEIGRAILETDIVFNTAYNWGTSGTSTTEMDVQTIATHEMGHWLNLRDLYGLPNTWGPGDSTKIMYGYGSEGIVNRAPTPADVAGVQWIYSAARRDTQRPTSTATKAEQVRRLQTVRLTLLVNDPEYTCGAAALRILIRNGSGRIVARIVGWGVATNEWSDIPYKCKLPRGTYRWQAEATDLTGRKQIKMIASKLVVR